MDVIADQIKDITQMSADEAGLATAKFIKENLFYLNCIHSAFAIHRIGWKISIGEKVMLLSKSWMTPIRFICGTLVTADFVTNICHQCRLGSIFSWNFIRFKGKFMNNMI